MEMIPKATGEDHCYHEEDWGKVKTEITQLKARKNGGIPLWAILSVLLAVCSLMSALFLAMNASEHSYAIEVREFTASTAAKCDSRAEKMAEFVTENNSRLARIETKLDTALDRRH